MNAVAGYTGNMDPKTLKELTATASAAVGEIYAGHANIANVTRAIVRRAVRGAARSRNDPRDVLAELLAQESTRVARERAEQQNRLFYPSQRPSPTLATVLALASAIAGNIRG